MRIDLLCSGSKGNCCLIRSKETQLIIDCGSTKRYLTNSLQKVHAELKDTNALLITHGHSDHIKQIKMFDSTQTFSYCPLEDVNNHRLVEPLEIFQIKDLSIQVIPLSHDSPKTVGYVIFDGVEKLVYITDTGYLANSNKPYLVDANYYIFESNHDVEMLMQTNRPLYLKQRILSPNGHLNNEESAANLVQLVGAHTSDIVLAHLSEEANTPNLALQALESTFAKKQVSLEKIHVQAAGQYEIVTIGSNSR